MKRCLLYPEPGELLQQNGDGDRLEISPAMRMMRAAEWPLVPSQIPSHPPALTPFIEHPTTASIDWQILCWLTVLGCIFLWLALVTK